MASTSNREGAMNIASFFRGAQALSAIAFAIFVVRFIARGIYRVYFHPLSKYPGPKIRAFTRIPGHIATWNGTLNQTYGDLHRKYGYVVRINHDELSITDPNAWKDIYGHGTKGTAGAMPHKPWRRYGQMPGKASNLINASDEDHSRMRKIFTPAFSDRALKQQEPLFVRYTDQLVSKLKEGIQKNPGKSIDMVRMYNFATFDVMGDLTFGEPLHMIESAEYDPWVKAIFAGIKFSSRMSIMINYPAVWAAFKGLFPTTLNSKRLKHFNFATTRVTKRLEKGRSSEGVDLWDLVLSQKEGRGLSRDEMNTNASLFMLAGTETTATLVSGLTFFLLSSPPHMQRLVAEIRGAFASSDDMTMEKLAALPLLGACIKEAFRLYPPVASGLPRIVPEEGSTVVGNFIPPGTTVKIPQHAMNTHELNFIRPLEFLPERWLGDKRFDGDARHAVQPFSIGTRDCLGKNMANHEIRILIAKVLYAFDLELEDKSSNWVDQKTYMLWQKKPLMCRLKAAN